MNKRQVNENLSRLVKSTRDADRPSDAFTEQLIGRALDQLRTEGRPRREERSTAMKTIFRVLTAAAACLAIVAAIFVASQWNRNRDEPDTTVRKPELQEPRPAESTQIAMAAPEPPDLIPLPFELPKPMFVGTPQNIEGVPRLEKPRGAPRPPFYAPADVRIISRGMPVAGSDPFPIMGELAMVTDGDKEAADGSYIEMGPFLQHVTIDLEQEYELYAVLLWHFHKQARVYFDVVVQVSRDPDFLDAITLYNNDDDNSAGLGVGQDLMYVETNEGRLIDAKGRRARYIRLWSNGNTANDLNHLIEVEVWGRNPVASAAHTPEPLDITLPKPMFVGTPENIDGLHRRHSYRQPSAVDVQPQPAQPYTPASRPRHEVAAEQAEPAPAERYAPAVATAPQSPVASEDVALPDTMLFREYGTNGLVDAAADAQSTFAIDVDTGSFTLCRRYLNDNTLPPSHAVRVEEFLNYFDYGYPAPQDGLFAVYADLAPVPAWGVQAHVMRIAVKAREIPLHERRPAVLTFVVDVSGSMNRENRLGLVKQTLEHLLGYARPDDRIGIAVYGSRGQCILEHVPFTRQSEIRSALRRLQPGGSTNAEEGLRIGYDMAMRAFRPDAVNRVILCSDGVANVGRTGPEAILQQIRDKTDEGVTLTTLGFGMGNYNDALMEQLADQGNGQYAYIDSFDEARRFFHNLTGMLETVARDVKVQVEFNANTVSAYRLIGYENRDVPDHEFRDDTRDGGEVGAGHSVTALYEVHLRSIAPGLIANTRIRYKDPETWRPIEHQAAVGVEHIRPDLERAGRDLRLAVAVSELAEILRGNSRRIGWDMARLQSAAQRLIGDYPGDAKVRELPGLVQKACTLHQTARSHGPTRLQLR